MTDGNDIVEQIRRSHKNARPKQSNPVAINAHLDLGVVLKENERLRAALEAIQIFVDTQAEDEGLWCEAQYASEEYIQRGLRGCHAYIESVIKDGPKPHQDKPSTG